MEGIEGGSRGKGGKGKGKKTCDGQKEIAVMEEATEERVNEAVVGSDDANVVTQVRGHVSEDEHDVVDENMVNDDDDGVIEQLLVGDSMSTPLNVEHGEVTGYNGAHSMLKGDDLNLHLQPPLNEVDKPAGKKLPRENSQQHIRNCYIPVPSVQEDAGTMLDGQPSTNAHQNDPLVLSPAALERNQNPADSMLQPVGDPFDDLSLPLSDVELLKMYEGSDGSRSYESFN